jgi:hypothetical protein
LSGINAISKRRRNQKPEWRPISTFCPQTMTLSKLSMIDVMTNNHSIYVLKRKTMTINKTWHEKNKMPKNASFEQRLKWHREHQEHCSCHPGLPKKLMEEMKQRGIKF